MSSTFTFTNLTTMLGRLEHDVGAALSAAGCNMKKKPTDSDVSDIVERLVDKLALALKMGPYGKLAGGNPDFARIMVDQKLKEMFYAAKQDIAEAIEAVKIWRNDVAVPMMQPA